MKFTKRLIIVMCLFLGSFVFNASISFAQKVDFKQLIQESDLIVEGKVVAQNDSSVEAGDATFQKVSYVRIDRVLHGSAMVGGKAVVLSHTNSIPKSSLLEINKDYLLCLKRSTIGYTVSDWENGLWPKSSNDVAHNQLLKQLDDLAAASLPQNPSVDVSEVEKVVVPEVVEEANEAADLEALQDIKEEDQMVTNSEDLGKDILEDSVDDQDESFQMNVLQPSTIGQ